MSEPERPWKILDSTLAHDGSPWIRVFQDRIETGSGQVVDDFYRVEAKDFALVFGRDAEGRILMLRQWRQGPQRFAYSFPGGHVDDGEDPAQTALRELTEEAGYTAASVRPLGRFNMHANFGIGWGNFFLADGLTRTGGASGDEDLETASVRLLDETELRDALQNGEVATMHDALCALLALDAGG